MENCRSSPVPRGTSFVTKAIIFSSADIVFNINNWAAKDMFQTYFCHILLIKTIIIFSFTGSRVRMRSGSGLTRHVSGGYL